MYAATSNEIDLTTKKLSQHSTSFTNTGQRLASETNDSNEETTTKIFLLIKRPAQKAARKKLVSLNRHYLLGFIYVFNQLIANDLSEKPLSVTWPEKVSDNRFSFRHTISPLRTSYKNSLWNDNDSLLCLTNHGTPLATGRCLAAS